MRPACDEGPAGHIARRRRSARPEIASLARAITSAGWTVRSYASAGEFLEVYDPSKPGCILLDMRMPGMCGTTIQRRLASRGFHPSIVFVTGYADVPEAVQAVRSGAIDVLVKPVSDQQLLSAIERAVEHDVWSREDESRRAEIRRRWALLSRREQQVVKLVLSGMLNKQIAAELGISQRTVEVHRYHAMKKMQANHVVELYKMLVEILEYRESETTLRTIRDPADPDRDRSKSRPSPNREGPDDIGHSVR